MTASAPSRPRCKICGDSEKVARGIYRLKSGKFVDIMRCVDHASCSERAAKI
jgi:hypothetical protein